MGTTHYNLTQPLSTDRFNLQVWNDNLEQIDQRMYLNQTTTFNGATELVPGSVGNVPAPQTSDKDKFLKGDGTWATPSGGGGGGSSTLAGLSDVNLASPTNGQGLIYDATNQKWINGYVGSGGGGSFETAFEGSKSSNTWANPLVFNEFSLDDYERLILHGTYQGATISWEVSVEDIPTLTATTGSNTAKIYGEVYHGKYNDEYYIFVSTGWNITITEIEGYKSSGGGSSEVSYSSTEHKIGTWLDGSDLYEKTIYYTATSVPSTSDIALTSLLSGNEDIVDSQGYVNYEYQSDVERYYINSHFAWINNDRGTYYLSIVFGSATLDSIEAYITIRYTKTGGNS